MSMFDGILGNIAAAPDDVRNLAHKIGIEPEVAERAIAVLAQMHQKQGDTVEGAAAETGLSPDILRQIIAAIGGEGSLMQFASMFDQDGDGNPFDDLGGLTQGLFGKK
ncbi:hypothetical protein GRI91_00395 [Altererythrobacter endophyticus]|uniref:Uncharacterized protein n=2 Tax=Altericroceibacterium endophyticum TaxID=1808508 RepID=A0A6I4T273_9SPHN|nr:hypothetical protein [Altericroceibacterium endophyticum]MXO64219.1 hypothetical protein [Altericroceibacterium endophyticum]